jgi:hypothetical protein
VAQDEPKRLRASPRRATSPEDAKPRRGRPPGPASGPRGTPGPIAAHMIAGFVPSGRIAEVLGLEPSSVIRRIRAGQIAAKDLAAEGGARTSYRWLVDVLALAEQQRAELPPGSEPLERLERLLREIDAYAAEHAEAAVVRPTRRRIAAALRGMEQDKARAAAG